MSTTKAEFVSVQATKRNTTVHLGDGRKICGPVDDENGDEIDGETAEDVPTAVAEAIVAKKLGKIVR